MRGAVGNFVIYGGLICVQLAEEAVLKTGTGSNSSDQGGNQAPGETMPDLWQADLL
jgi:hypothetical protein